MVDEALLSSVRKALRAYDAARPLLSKLSGTSLPVLEEAMLELGERAWGSEGDVTMMAEKRQVERATERE